MRRRLVSFAIVAALAACAAPATLTPTEAPIAAPSASAPGPEPIASEAPAEPPPPDEPPAPVAEGPCPTGMKYVDGTYCSNVERTCLRTEHNKPNHIDICHKFKHETKCRSKEEKRSFCIDEYEYPNEKGAHPPWMVSWYDAQATCESKGKRLCYESEWVTACEGPEHTPFPYGWDRSHDTCNIDNQWIDPRLSEAYSKNTDTSEAELERLDQSVASGALEGCVSGYGVHDLTGNFDEWVTSDKSPREKSEWAGLKGGAWGHVRNACRPMTASHPPEFTYYFISFRCCADAKGSEPFRPTTGAKAPKVEPEDRAPLPHPKNSTGPSTKKVEPEN